VNNLLKVVKLAFHYDDTNTDANILARK